MDTVHNETVDNMLLNTHYTLGCIYKSLTQIPDLEKRVAPQQVIDFFKEYEAKLARRKLGLPAELTATEESQYNWYRGLVYLLENRLICPHFRPVVREQYQVNTDSAKLSHFKEDFEKLGQSIDVICIMTGGFLDSVMTSEYLRNLGKDPNLILLYTSRVIHLEDDVQIFNSEKARMRKDVLALIVDDNIQKTDTVKRVASYLTREGYGDIFIFSPQTHKVSNSNLEIIKSELPHKRMGAQLLKFRPQS